MGGRLVSLLFCAGRHPFPIHTFPFLVFFIVCVLGTPRVWSACNLSLVYNFQRSMSRLEQR